MALITSKFFIELARQGDPTAKTVVFRTKVFMGTGIAGAFLASFIKHLNP
jgi:hypothetical protein